MKLLAFTDQQIDKLSDLFMSIAKGYLLATVAFPFAEPSSIWLLLWLLGTGIIWAYLSLKILEAKVRKS